MQLALVGQPNCGKSTIFNQVAGYRAETGNFSGTTVSYTECKVRVMGDVVELVDLPGTYTLTGRNPAEQITLRYLASHEVDVIINVVDASQLSQGLGLTLELLELQRPMVVALNMMDEAARLGMKIDGPKLQDILGAPVLPLVASKGRGVRNLFITAKHVGQTQQIPQRPKYGRDIEEAIDGVLYSLNGHELPLKPVPLAIKLLEGDEAITLQVAEHSREILPVVRTAQERLETQRGQKIIWLMSGERHGLAANITHQVVEQGERRISWRDRLDDVLLHPFWGYIVLIAIFLIFFEIIFGIGSAIEVPLLSIFDSLSTKVGFVFETNTLWSEILNGTLMGIAGGVAIVLPYLLPFLIGLGFLEDIGYLPRVAFLMDSLMNRIGLHGKAIVPFILGYGCNVPAVMSTRTLEDRRDRFLAAALATLVPCAARLAVVFGLVAFYLGPRLALGIYIFNLLVIAITGRILSGMLPEDTPGLILEMPVYRVPTMRTVLGKGWFRAKEFIVEAWPLLIIGSIILAVLNYLDYARIFNTLVRPVTWVLGLPVEVGVPLIFGILRKELSLVMLSQAMGTNDFAAVMTAVQMVTFTVFVVFYIPCLATIAVLKRELSFRDMLIIVGLTVLIAVLAALAARGLMMIPWILRI